jgi:hypothetical protein
MPHGDWGMDFWVSYIKYWKIQGAKFILEFL